MERLSDLGCKEIKFDYFCLDALKEASKGTQENYVEAFSKICKAESLEIQNGLIFKQSDMFFYKGFLKFQLK